MYIKGYKLNVFAPVLFGVLSSLIYTLFKFFGLVGGISLFCFSSFLVSVFLICISPRSFFYSLKNKDLHLRGIVFGISQSLIIEGQRYEFTSNILIAVIISTLFLFVFMSLYEKRGIDFNLMISVLIASTSLFFIEFNNIFSFGFGALSGGLLGLLIYLSKKTIDRSKAINVLQVSFVYSFIFSLLILNFHNSFISNLENIEAFKIIIFSFILIFFQFFYLWMSKLNPSDKTSLLLSSRIPSIFICEFLFFNLAIDRDKVIVSFLIILSNILIFSRLSNYLASFKRILP